MELSKCTRCGCFFTSHNNICPSCEPKEINEFSKLKSFLAENEQPNCIESLASDTGISLKNLNRFLAKDEFENIADSFGIKKNGNISNIL